MGSVIARAAVGLGQNVDFTSKDRFNPRVAAGIVKIDGAVHDSVVGHGQRVHAQFFGTFDQRFDVAGSVQQDIFGVEMEVDKRLVHMRGSAGRRGESGKGKGARRNPGSPLLFRIAKRWEGGRLKNFSFRARTEAGKGRDKPGFFDSFALAGRL